MKTLGRIFSLVSLALLLIIAGGTEVQAGEKDYLLNLPDSIKKKNQTPAKWFTNGSVKLGAGTNGHVVAFEIAVVRDLLLEGGMSSWMFIGRGYGQLKYRVYKNFNHALRIGVEGAEMYQMSVIRGGKKDLFEFLPMAIAEFEFFDFSVSAGYSLVPSEISIPGYLAFNYFVVLNPEVHKANKTKFKKE